MVTTPSFNSNRGLKSRTFKLGNRYFGTLKEDRNFHRTVKLSRHLLRKWDSFGIDLWLIKELECSNCLAIIFHEKEEAKIYSICFKDFLANARKADFGRGVQLHVKRSYWKVERLPLQLTLI